MLLWARWPAVYLLRSRLTRSPFYYWAVRALRASWAQTPWPPLRSNLTRHPWREDHSRCSLCFKNSLSGPFQDFRCFSCTSPSISRVFSTHSHRFPSCKDALTRTCLSFHLTHCTLQKNSLVVHLKWFHSSKKDNFSNASILSKGHYGKYHATGMEMIWKMSVINTLPLKPIWGNLNLLDTLTSAPDSS